MISSGETYDRTAAMAVPYLACMALVASIYNLPPRVLPSIMMVEGGRVGSVQANTNGSEDLGIMQVNTIWLLPLSRYTGLAEHVVRDRLVNRACFNIAAAGAIVHLYLNETGGELMRAIGNYHSHTPARNQHYQSLVQGAAAKLFGTAPNTRQSR